MAHVPVVVISDDEDELGRSPLGSINENAPPTPIARRTRSRAKDAGATTTSHRSKPPSGKRRGPVCRGKSVQADNGVPSRTELDAASLVSRAVISYNIRHSLALLRGVAEHLGISTNVTSTYAGIENTVEECHSFAEDVLSIGTHGCKGLMLEKLRIANGIHQRLECIAAEERAERELLEKAVSDIVRAAQLLEAAEAKDRLEKLASLHEVAYDLYDSAHYHRNRECESKLADVCWFERELLELGVEVDSVDSNGSNVVRRVRRRVVREIDAYQVEIATWREEIKAERRAQEEGEKRREEIRRQAKAVLEEKRKEEEGRRRRVTEEELAQARARAYAAERRRSALRQQAELEERKDVFQRQYAAWLAQQEQVEEDDVRDEDNYCELESLSESEEEDDSLEEVDEKIRREELRREAEEGRAKLASERAAARLAEMRRAEGEAMRAAERQVEAEAAALDKIGWWDSLWKGNIVMQLSTLELVLPSGCSWKAIGQDSLTTQNSIKKAYRRACLQVHPDRMLGRGDAFSDVDLAVAKEVFIQLQESYEMYAFYPQ